MPINQRNAGFISATYQPLQVANAPTIGAATGGDASASVAFTAPANVGGSAISAYYAVSNPDRVTVSGASSPITVTGLTNGTAYTFTVWALNTYGPSPFSGASGSVSPAAPRGVFGAGVNSSFAAINVMEYITISSTGNATDFGDLTVARNYGVGSSSATRGLFIGDDGNNTIDYITIATTGNGLDFGDMGPTLFYYPMGASNSTRSVYQYGYDLSTPNNVIFFLTIATTGNGADFGDLTVARHSGGALASSTRAVFAGGDTGAGQSNVMDFVTIASAGNATDFGDLVVGEQKLFTAGCSSSTRGLWMGGADGAGTNTISFITIATAGNTTDFGDLSAAKGYCMSTSSATRGVCAGGYSPLTNVIEYVTIASAGNATDFGDLLVLNGVGGGLSNSHGGL